MALARRAGCIACHSLDARVVGPSFREVASRYQGDANAAARLADKLRTGGSGVWGSVPMPAQAISPDDAAALLHWILGGAK